jgi:hypothetical protein
MTYWAGEAMRSTDSRDLAGGSMKTHAATKLAAAQAAHLATLLAERPLPERLTGARCRQPLARVHVPTCARGAVCAAVNRSRRAAANISDCARSTSFNAPAQMRSAASATSHSPPTITSQKVPDIGFPFHPQRRSPTRTARFGTLDRFELIVASPSGPVSRRRGSDTLAPEGFP